MTVNIKMSKKFGFQYLLYVRFIIEKRYRVDAVAQNMKIHRDTLYKWIRGENAFPIDQLPNLTKATSDCEHLNYLAGEAGFTIMERVKDQKVAKVVSRIAQALNSCINGHGDEE